MKTFSKIEISVIKSTAKNVAPFVAKKAKVDVQIADTKAKIQKMLEEKLQKLEAEKAGYQSIIDSMNQAVKQITGGYTTEDLITITKEGTGQMGDNGKEIMKTVYNLKYPETVIPVVTPTPEEQPGSDFDKDAEAECPTHEEAPEEMPEELMEEQAEVAEEAAEADPFADGDPFNQQ
jgi:DNA repair exonuclease SbcCD ATPase subunit